MHFAERPQKYVMPVHSTFPQFRPQKKNKAKRHRPFDFYMPFSINRRRSASFLCSGFSLPLSSCGRRSKTIKYGNFSDPNRHTVSSIQYPETRTGPHIMHICVHIDVVPVAATSVCHITPYPPPYIYRYSPPFRGGSRKKMGWLGWHTDNYFRLRISVR